MMANTSRLECRTGYLLLLRVAIGLLILPSGLSQWCNTNDGEPLIKVSSTPPSNKLPIGASINLTCTAWENDNQAMRTLKTRPHRIEWFDRNDVLFGECKAKSPAAARMKCTLIVGALTEEKFGNYTCKASNGYNYCSNKRFSIIHQDAQVSESKEETEDETIPTPEPNDVEESKIKSTEGKKATVNYTEEDIVCISKKKLQLECPELPESAKVQ